MAILNELTQLSKMENSKVALRARQVSSSTCILKTWCRLILKHSLAEVTWQQERSSWIQDHVLIKYIMDSVNTKGYCFGINLMLFVNVS